MRLVGHVACMETCIQGLFRSLNERYRVGNLGVDGHCQSHVLGKRRVQRN